jgi:hypothetical protein
MYDKKMVTTQHVKYIEALKRTRNSSLLYPTEDSGNVVGSVANTDSVASTEYIPLVGGSSPPP